MAFILQNSQQDPWWVYPVVLGGLAGIVLLIWSINGMLNHFFPNRKKRAYRAAVGNTLMTLEPIFQPSREHIIEAREYKQTEDDGDGDPPTTGE
jgi:hypothetical protein